MSSRSRLSVWTVWTAGDFGVPVLGLAPFLLGQRLCLLQLCYLLMFGELVGSLNHGGMIA